MIAFNCENLDAIWLLLESTTAACQQVVAQLLAACLADFELAPSTTTIELQLPTVVLEECMIAGDSTLVVADSIREENDLGWMYVTLQNSGDSVDMVKVNETVPHLIWPSDSF